MGKPPCSYTEQELTIFHYKGVLNRKRPAMPGTCDQKRRTIYAPCQALFYISLILLVDRIAVNITIVAATRKTGGSV